MVIQKTNALVKNIEKKERKITRIRKKLQLKSL